MTSKPKKEVNSATTMENLENCDDNDISVDDNDDIDDNSVILTPRTELMHSRAISRPNQTIGKEGYQSYAGILLYLLIWMAMFATLFYYAFGIMILFEDLPSMFSNDFCFAVFFGLSMCICVFISPL